MGPWCPGRDKHTGFSAAEKPHRLSLARDRQRRRRRKKVWKGRKKFESEKEAESDETKEREGEAERQMDGSQLSALGLVCLQRKLRLISPPSPPLGPVTLLLSLSTKYRGLVQAAGASAKCC